MSHATYIRCDACRGVAQVFYGQKGQSLTAVRSAARKTGWRRGVTRSMPDLCPTHARHYGKN